MSAELRPNESTVRLPSEAIGHVLPVDSTVNRPNIVFWRFRLISVCLLLGWVVIIVRLIQVQGAQRQLMNDGVARQSIFSEVIPARPGEILDRNGQVLAMTITCDSLYAVPDEIEQPWDFAWKVSPVLNLNADELYHRLVTNADKRFVWIKRRIEDEQVEQLRSLSLPKSSWGLRREYQRQYPQGGYAAHVLGSETSTTRDREDLSRACTMLFEARTVTA